MKNVVAILFFVCTMSTVYADVVNTKISQVGAATDQYAIIVLKTAAPTKPACAEEYKIMSFDKSTPHGRDMYSLAITALTAQKTLHVEYSNTSCGLWGVRTLVTRLDMFDY